MDRIAYIQDTVGRVCKKVWIHWLRSGASRVAGREENAGHFNSKIVKGPGALSNCLSLS